MFNIIILKNFLFIIFSFIACMILAIIPLPSQVVFLRPEFLMLVLIFWVINRQNIVGINFAFILGVFVDLLQNNTLGVSSLALVVVAYLTNLLRIKLKALFMWQRALTILFIVGAYKLILLWSVLLTKDIAIPHYYWISILVTALCWPLVRYVMEYYKKIFVYN